MKAAIGYVLRMLSPLVIGMNYDVDHLPQEIDEVHGVRMIQGAFDLKSFAVIFSMLVYVRHRPYSLDQRRCNTSCHFWKCVLRHIDGKSARYTRIRVDKMRIYQV